MKEEKQKHDFSLKGNKELYFSLAWFLFFTCILVRLGPEFSLLGISIIVVLLVKKLIEFKEEDTKKLYTVLLESVNVFVLGICTILISKQFETKTFQITFLVIGILCFLFCIGNCILVFYTFYLSRKFKRLEKQNEKLDERLLNINEKTDKEKEMLYKEILNNIDEIIEMNKDDSMDVLTKKVSREIERIRIIIDKKGFGMDIDVGKYVEAYFNDKEKLQEKKNQEGFENGN